MRYGMDIPGRWQRLVDARLHILCKCVEWNNVSAKVQEGENNPWAAPTCSHLLVVELSTGTITTGGIYYNLRFRMAILIIILSIWTCKAFEWQKAVGKNTWNRLEQGNSMVARRVVKMTQVTTVEKLCSDITTWWWCKRQDRSCGPDSTIITRSTRRTINQVICRLQVH